MLVKHLDLRQSNPDRATRIISDPAENLFAGFVLKSIAPEVFFGTRYRKSTNYAGTSDAQRRSQERTIASLRICEEESMHNIDRTNLESSYGEYPGEYAGEYAAPPS